MPNAVTIKKTGPLFAANAVGVFVDGLMDGLKSVDEEFVDEVTKRYKKGKGYATGALAGSYGSVREIGKLTAAADSSGVQRYTHRVEYGSRFMKAQNQRKNARQAIKRSLNNPMSARSQKILAEAVDRLNG